MIPVSQRKTVKDILELPDGWTLEVAKSNFRRLIKQYHPDINKDPEAIEYSRKLIKAYNMVTGKEKRQQQPVQRPQQPQKPIIYYWYSGDSTNSSGTGFGGFGGFGF